MNYKTKEGHLVWITLAGREHWSSDNYRMHSNDYNTFQLLNLQWGSEKEVQKRLDNLAKENGWELIKKD